jgi:hypothetical protein
LPGTLIFSHPDRSQVELMLDHEAIRWGRSLKVGDSVTLQGEEPTAAVVRQLQPWRERTQVLLAVEASDQSRFKAGQRVLLRMAAPPVEIENDALPTGLGILSRSKPDRVEWLAASVYCPCMMHDECAGHFFTLTACNAGADNPCGMAKRMREEFGEMIERGRTDEQIIGELLKAHGPKLLRPHMMP